MSESSPHAGTGSYGCDDCGRRFPWTKHEMSQARAARENHVCTPCVFCPDNWGNLNVVQCGDPAFDEDEGVRFAIINPLDPVTDGHVLVIASFHSRDASENPGLAGDAMLVAADYVRKQGIQANIITSIGPNATQTVMHTHVHVVPRRENDGLSLPWTPQHMRKEIEKLRILKQIEQESGGSGSMGIFQQADRVGWADARTKQ